MRDYYDDGPLDERERETRPSSAAPDTDFRRSDRTFRGRSYETAPHWRHRNRSSERDPQFGSDSYRQGLARDETARLIAADKVEGTAIFDRNGRKLGSIETLMLDKRTGEVSYVVVRNSTGFLGLNDRYFPLEWCELTYDSRVHGYGVEFTEDELDRQFNRDERARRAMHERDRDDGYNHRAQFYW